MGVQFQGWRYAGGGISMFPSTTASSTQVLPFATGSTSATAKFVMAQCATSSTITGGMSAAIKFIEAGSSSGAASSAAAADCLVTSNEARVFAVQGYKFVSVIGLSVGAQVNIAPIEW